jgi:hypothetical protein
MQRGSMAQHEPRVVRAYMMGCGPMPPSRSHPQAERALPYFFKKTERKRGFF